MANWLNIFLNSDCQGWFIEIKSVEKSTRTNWGNFNTNFFIRIHNVFIIKNQDEKIVDKKGIIYAILSALFFGTNAFIQKYATNHSLVYSQQVYFSALVFLSALLYIFVKEKDIKVLNYIKNKDNMLGMVGGCIYFLLLFSNFDLQIHTRFNCIYNCSIKCSLDCVSRNINS